MTEILSVQRWPTNAHLLADVERLHFRSRDTLLDTTYGRGVWWQRTTKKPDVAHDIRTDGVDFRDLPHAARSFDVVAYDPPYVVTGGKSTSTLPPDFHDRYGMHVPTTYSPADLARDLLNPGLAECVRVARRLVLVKCMDYTVSGHLYLGETRLIEEAERLGCRIEDKLVMLGNPARQPRTKRCPYCGATVSNCPECAGTGKVARGQKRAWRNSSTLLVLRRPR